MSEPQLTPFERIKVQMQATVPLIRSLQAELGDEVVLEALEARLQRRIEAAKAKAPTDVSVELRLQGAKQSFEYFDDGGVLEYDVVIDEPELLGVDVQSCGYARMMAEMDATDIGHLLICSEDHVLVAASGTTLERTQTCMQGASHCDFRFRPAEG